MTELELIRRELSQMAAGSWAMQTLLVCLIARLSNREHGIGDLLRDALDDASNLVEQLAVMGGQDRAAAARIAVQVSEELGAASAAQVAPRRSVVPAAPSAPRR